MNKDELLAALKSEHGIDVPALQSAVAAASEVTPLSARLGAAFVDSNMIALSASQEIPSDDQIVEAVGKMATELAETHQKVALTSAESKIDKLIGEGRVLPAKRDAYVKLSLTNPELLDDLVPAEPIVELTKEVGTNASESDRVLKASAVTEAIEEYENLARVAGFAK